MIGVTDRQRVSIAGDPTRSSFHSFLYASRLHKSSSYKALYTSHLPPQVQSPKPNPPIRQIRKLYPTTMSSPTYTQIPLDKFQEEFKDTSTEVSSVALGGRIVGFSDEFFAEAENLIKV
jgi:hypothetical protein